MEMAGGHMWISWNDMQPWLQSVILNLTIYGGYIYEEGTSGQCAKGFSMGLQAMKDVNNYYNTYVLWEQLLNYFCSCEGKVRDAPLLRSQSLCELQEYKGGTLWICFPASMTTTYLTMCWNFATAMEPRIFYQRDILLGEPQQVLVSWTSWRHTV